MKSIVENAIAQFRLRLLSTLFLAFPAAASLDLPPADEKAGNSLFEYGIYRNGSQVGSHRIEVQRTGQLTKVRSESDIDISMLGFSLYRFVYDAKEIWDEQGLLQLSVRLDDDGERFRLEGRRTNGNFRWSVNDEASFAQPLPVFPTNHWNRAVLNQDLVLNTLTGRLNAVKIRSVESPGREANPPHPKASAYRYSGDLRLVSWYADNGHWLGMRFEGDDGSTIEYSCRNCSEYVGP